MRLLPIAISATIVAATLSSAGYSKQQGAEQIDARSILLTKEGQSALTIGQYDKARDSFETALAVDPRNRAAYIGLGRAALGMKMPGKAIGFYAEALAIEPNNR